VKNGIGRVTLPTEIGIDDEIKEVMGEWGADAIRNSDGTQLSSSLLNMGKKVYATYKLCRNDQEWAKNHMDQLQQVYLMTEHITATEDNLEIEIMKGYFTRQIKVNYKDDPKQWWEVINRTTGEIINVDDWSYNEKTGKVTIHNTEKYNCYTVAFLAYVIWDPVHMYNHLTNKWTTPEQMPYDVRHRETRAHVLEYLEKWLVENEQVDVVRFTTFFYNFTLIFNDDEKEKFVDWFGYSASVSPEAILEFEKEYNYRPRPEHFVDAGYHNTPFKIPSKEFKDWLEFQEKFVGELMKECVDLCHKYNKEAMMFLGDHWIGTEPYGNTFRNIGMDAVVGSVGSGATCRMISDIPGVKYTEGRFLPYFFPDNFSEGCNPIIQAEENWLQARRAIMRNPLDRMGYGGYLSLALKFPQFIERVGDFCGEFREIHMIADNEKPHSAFKIAVINAWGAKRTWMTNMVAHAKWYKKIYSYVGVIESLSGLPFDVEFISFDDIKEKGIDSDIKVIINAGDGGTAWSGDEYWKDKDIITKIREFVHNGGGFIGIGEPSAKLYEGRYFQLAEILGVDRELGFTLSYTQYDEPIDYKHFIIEDMTAEPDLGEDISSIRKVVDDTKILLMKNGDTKIAVNEFGKGRSVYITGLPYNYENCRLLLRSIYWSANSEKEMYNWYTSNTKAECSVFKKAGYVAVYNNTTEPINTRLYKDSVNYIDMSLKGSEIQWHRTELI